MNNLIYLPANIDNVTESSQPDFYVTGSEKPSDSFVVSRLRDGKVMSVYGDNVWDFSPYEHRRKKSRIHFNYWGVGEGTSTQKKVRDCLKWIMFCLIWQRFSSKYATSTIVQLSQFVCRIAHHAETNGYEFLDMFTCEAPFRSMVDSLDGQDVTCLNSILSTLSRLDLDSLQFKLLPDSVLNYARIKGTAIKKRRRQLEKQTPPMPTRIYSAVLSGLSNELGQWEKIEAESLDLASRCAKDPMLGRSIRNQYDIAEKLNIKLKFRPVWCDIVPQSLSEYLQTYYYSGRSHDVACLSGLISQVQLTCRLTIQSYTGMRKEEADTLPYHCLYIKKLNGQPHYIILGQTTKLNNGRVRMTRWVTNKEGMRAIEIARRIADTIYAYLGVSPTRPKLNRCNHPLFIAPSYLGIAGGSLEGPMDGRYLANDCRKRRTDELMTRITPIIEESDLGELDKIAPNVYVNDDQYMVGARWPLKSHQFRRSLALYAHRSGLVSLPSLRRQLQHLTNEMTIYYSKGSALAKKIIGDDVKHFGTEWQDMKSESDGLSYILNVLLSDDVLFGGHASWVEHRVKNPNGIILVNREDTMRRFKRGELAYKETPIGGCTKVGECNSPALNWLDTECLESNCRNMVCNLSKLERVIKAQEKFVQLVPTGTVQRNTEEHDLSILKSVRDSLVAKQEAQ